MKSTRPPLPWWEEAKTSHPRIIEEPGPQNIIQRGDYRFDARENCDIRVAGNHSFRVDGDYSAYFRSNQKIEVKGDKEEIVSGSFMGQYGKSELKFTSLVDSVAGKRSTRIGSAWNIFCNGPIQTISIGKWDHMISETVGITVGGEVGGDAIHVCAAVGNIYCRTAAGDIQLDPSLPIKKILLGTGTATEMEPVICGNRRQIADEALISSVMAAVAAFTITPTMLGPMPGVAAWLPAVLDAWKMACKMAITSKVQVQYFPSLG